MILYDGAKLAFYLLSAILIIGCYLLYPVFFIRLGDENRILPPSNRNRNRNITLIIPVRSAN